MTSSPLDEVTSSSAGEPSASLRERIGAYLRAHHVASLATVGPHGSPDAGMPHAASVFYATDERLRLVFLSKGSSRHGRDIAAGSLVSVTVTEQYDDWRAIQGVQLRGRATVLHGLARAGALATYVRRFPFVRATLSDPALASRLVGIEVYRVAPEWASLTDNRRAVFGREELDDLAEET